MTLSVLLAEDDAQLQDAVAEALQTQGFEVAACNDAESALDLAERRQFDLALFDLVMPGMTGVDAISNLRRLQPNIGVVITTAFATVETAVDSMKHGADDFITKPFNVVTLATTLKRIHAQKQQQLQLPEEDANKVFSAISNPMRRAVLLQLAQHKKLRFMDLCRLAQVENHTQFNFHLRQLRQCDLVIQDDNKQYSLSSKGQQMLQLINSTV